MNEYTITKFTAARPLVNEISIFEIKKQRNKMLVQSDWTQMPDSPLSPELRAEWATYRQALRDLPNSGDVNNIVWPQQP
jgi:hypothetical protein